MTTTPSAITGMAAPQLRAIVWSAHTEAAARDYAARLSAFLAAEPVPDLAAVAATLTRSRTRHRCRAGTVAADPRVAAGLLAANSYLRMSGQGVASRRVAVILPGQGSQYPRMGLGLYAVDEAFRTAADEAFAALAAAGSDTRVRWEAAEDHGDDSRLLQPLQFAVDYALARAVLAQGIHPAVLIGHGPGELLAACLAGVMSLRDCARVVAASAQAMAGQPEGRMISADAALSVLGDVRLRAPRIPVLSTVTGDEVTEKEALSPAFWARNAAEPAALAAAVAKALAEPTVLLQARPSAALTAAVAGQSAITDGDSVAVPVLPAPRGRRASAADEQRALLTAVVRTWVEGGDVDWPRRPEQCRIPPLTAEPAAAPAAATPRDRAGDIADETAGLLISMLREVLGVDAAAPDDDFFELGGTSTSAVTFMAAIHERFGIEFGIGMLFDYPTPRQLAEAIREFSR